MPTPSQDVDRFVESLEEPLKGQVRRVREGVLAADERIVERKGWNAPSFDVRDDDRASCAVGWKRLPRKGDGLAKYGGPPIARAGSFLFPLSFRAF